MARPSLDEIFGAQPQQRPSLDEIFNAPAPQQQERPTLDQIFSGQAPQHVPDNQEKGFFDIAADAGRALLSPAATALEVISYLDKPRGAIAGTVKAAQDGGDLWEGAKQGWKENTSWKETFNPEWVKENPNLATAAGFAADVIADPTWILTPAKAVKGLAAGSKAIGLTDNVINPAVNAVKNTDIGASAIAKLEDIAGVNRVAQVQDAYNVGRATDNVIAHDYTDELGKLKKQFGSEADKATDYIEAAERTQQPVITLTDTVSNLSKDNKLATEIKAGNISREQAFNALRDAGEEIPDWLLQTHQRQAKQAGQAIPDYVYRDEVLSQIPDANLRKAIQTIGDKVIEHNKKLSDDIYNIGRIGDAEYVEFLGGSHLRRSYEKFETADDFLKELKKNGTADEWQKAYTDYQTKRSGVGPSATHKIDQRDFMKRQTLSEDTMKKMGIITDTEYRVLDTFNRVSKTLNEDKFLKEVDSMFGVSKDEAARLSRTLPESRQYVPIPDAKSYGALAGKWVPKDVANQIMNTLGTKADPEGLRRTWEKIVSWWKVSKLAAPAPIMRNLYSGLPMANVFGNVPMQSIPQDMARVLAAYSKGGKNNPLLREFRMSGALDGDWVGNELKNILGGKPKGIKRMAELGMEAFGTPDKFWRAVVFSYHRRQGKSIEEAGKIARQALLDYSSAPDWVNTLSRSGVMPFAKFPFLAGKQTAKALYNNPAQVTKYTKLQNQVNTEDREKIMPEYLKSRTLLPVGSSERIVNGKPQKVQQNIDLSYILPFASDMSLGNPLTDALMIAKTGRNGIGQQVIKPGMTNEEKAKAYGTFALNTVSPSVVSPYNIEKIYNGYYGNVDSKGRQYDVGDALAQTFLGVKNVPINIDEMFKQVMTKNQMEQRNATTMMNEIKKDKSLTPEQKKEKILEHQSQIQELKKQAQEMAKAYQREKKRGAI
jgi:hypothetical protein